MNQIPHLKGLIAAPFTPMKEDGALNLSLIPEYFQMLRANSVAGAFICGSTGEGVSLSLQEKKMVAEAWADASLDSPDFKVITLVGGTSLNDCVELARHAQASGLYGIAFTAPFYFKPATPSDLASCCKTVASAVPEMAFYYYHIPVLTGVGFPMIELLKNVHGQIPNFAGIKYTHEDFMDFLSCLHFADQQYDMLWGRDENMLPALSVGAIGSVGSTFNYAAPLYHALIAAFEKNDFEKARNLQQQAINMISLLGKYGGISTGKAFMKKIGIDCGKFRLPVHNMDDAGFDFFEKDLETIRFDSYCSQKKEQT